MTVKILDIEGLKELLNREEIEIDEAWPMIESWLARGDGVAVYRNEEIGHPMMGALKFVSFGGRAAQLEVALGFDPPKRLPDIGDEINWRYMLYAKFGGPR